MDRVEKGLLLLSGGLAPLATLRFAGVNLGAFDIAVLTLLAVQIVRRGSLPAAGWLYGVGAVVVIGGLASGVMATHPDLVLEQVLQWLFIFFVVVPGIFNAGKDPSSGRWLFAGVTGGLLFLVVHAAVQIFSGQGTYVAGRFAGFHGSPQLLAFTVSSFVPFVVIGPSVAPAQRTLSSALWQIGFLVLGASLAWLLFMTASRTGLLASLAAVGTIVAFMEWDALGRGMGPFLRRTFYILAFVVVLAGSLTVIVLAVTPEAVDVLARRLTLSMDASPELVGSRLRIYEEAISQLDVPTLLGGVGLGNYPFESEYSLRPHNLVLLSVWEGGIVFLAGLLAAFGLFVRNVVSAMGRWWSYDPVHRHVAAAAAAGVVAFLVIAMFNTQSVHRMYWFNYAFALGAFSTESRWGE